MSANRIYTLFSFAMLTALVIVGVLAAPMLAASLHPLGASPVSAEAARLAQRRGEWYAGAQPVREALDLHDRHPAAAANDAETARFVAYSNSLAEAARLAQRRGEWFAGGLSVMARLDQLAQIKDAVDARAVAIARLDLLAQIKDTR